MTSAKSSPAETMTRERHGDVRWESDQAAKSRRALTLALEGFSVPSRKREAGTIL